MFSLTVNIYLYNAVSFRNLVSLKNCLFTKNNFVPSFLKTLPIPCPFINAHPLAFYQCPSLAPLSMPIPWPIINAHPLPLYQFPSPVPFINARPLPLYQCPFPIYAHLLALNQWPLILYIFISFNPNKLKYTNWLYTLTWKIVSSKINQSARNESKLILTRLGLTLY